MTTLPTESYVRSLPAGRELDVLVATYVFNRPTCACSPAPGMYDPGSGFCKRCGYNTCSHYSSDWAAAGPLLEGQVWDIEEATVRLYTSRQFEIEYDCTKPNDLCRAIAIAVLLAALATRTTEGG